MTKSTTDDGPAGFDDSLVERTCAEGHLGDEAFHAATAEKIAPWERRLEPAAAKAELDRKSFEAAEAKRKLVEAREAAAKAAGRRVEAEEAATEAARRCAEVARKYPEAARAAVEAAHKYAEAVETEVCYLEDGPPF